MPDQIAPQLIENKPWLQAHQEKSITELEILKGVLNDPGMQKLSFFYFRDPAASRQVEQRLVGETGYRPEPDEARAKLETLKDKIRARQDTYPVPVRENYPDAETLGEQVLEDLWQIIDWRFTNTNIMTEVCFHIAIIEIRARTCFDYTKAMLSVQAIPIIT